MFLWLTIEEVLVSVIELFSCHKDDGSVYNDQADVVRKTSADHIRDVIGRETVFFVICLCFLHFHV